MTTPATFLEGARKRLVDISMRNRLLNYSGGKRSLAVEIFDEQPASLWNLLVNKRKKLTLRGRNTEVEPDPEQDADDEAFDDDVIEVVDLRDTPEKKHLDDFIDTRLTNEALSARLRKIDDTRRSAAEEQGVATLFLALGFLHYFETETSEKERRAPLILVPTTLNRTSRDTWQLAAGDDDPITNPGLVEYLKTHSLELPPLSVSDEKEVDLAPWFDALQRLAATQKRWRVSANCLIGNFSFQKFVMHEDIRRNADSISRHPLVGQFVRRQSQSIAFSELPPEVRQLDLDRDFAPEKTFQVVDADATQQRALAAVATGKDLVIQGPPGTGKSQTITNLIAHALANGRTVLFVAEKQAALNVVYDRLRKAGLGDFCLELHSTKGSKRSLAAEVKRAWDASVAPTSKATDTEEHLGKVRSQLTAYARALHSPVPLTGRTPYQVIGRCMTLQRAPEARFTLDPLKVDERQLRAALEALTTLGASKQRLGGEPEQHAWANTNLRDFGLDQQERAKDVLDELRARLARISEDAPVALESYGVPLRPLAEASEAYRAAAMLLGASPGVSPDVLASRDWQEVDQRASELIRRVRSVQERDAKSAALAPIESSLSEVWSAAQVVLARGGSIWAWFSGAWRAARRRLKAIIPQDSWVGAFTAAESIKERLAVIEMRQELETNEAARWFFGSGWRGAESDPEQLASHLAWCRSFREACESKQVGAAALAAVSTRSPDVGRLVRLADDTAAAMQLLAELKACVGWMPTFFENPKLDSLVRVVSQLADNFEGWRLMQAYQSALEAAKNTVAKAMFQNEGWAAIAPSALADAFERRFWRLWLDRVETTRPELKQFDGSDHHALIERFRKLDREMLEENRRRVVASLRQMAQHGLAAANEAKVTMRDQGTRTRGLLPPRQFLQKAFIGIRAVKPCFLMSPMSVAQFLQIDHKFDLVIFDEASQLTIEDALGAVSRGKQLVVVGDTKQLPPTNFFAVQLGETDADRDENGEPKLEQLESVLELAQASGFYGAQLKWHYRSRHESLIAFSNRKFYESSLLTFPSADRSVQEVGLSFEFVEGGIYEGKGTNSAEAARVVDAVVDFAREWPDRSLGIGTFSVAQQQRILDLLDARRRSEPHLESFLSTDKREPFFVKNLESIQGDERDVIFLSVTYGPSADGRIRNNFGPLNGDSGWRRLNVIATRARQQMRVFASMRADDMRFEKGLRGASLLRDFLAFAERGELQEVAASVSSTVESPFEREVAQALSEAGVLLETQVGVAGYRIDLGVVDEHAQGRFVCGIECDGATYHSAESARDRDRLREEVLRGLGWQLHRVWSTDWWHQRDRTLNRLLQLISESRQKARRAGVTRPPGANAPLAAAAEPPPAPPPVPAPRRQQRALEVPSFAPYRAATLPRQEGALPEAISSVILRLAERVVETEGPVHDDVIRSRLMDAFGHARSGTRIVARLDSELELLRRRPSVLLEGAFWRMAHLPAVPRRRDGVPAPTPPVGHDELREAVLHALRVNRFLTEAELTSVLRDALGLATATAEFREGLRRVLERLRALKTVSEAGDGFTLAESVQENGRSAS